jgi:uridylate kinase
MPRPRFNRILLKLSGEALMGDGQFGIDPDTVARLADEIRTARDDGHELCIVVGGGTSSAASPAPPRASTGRAPTIWACWRR